MQAWNDVWRQKTAPSAHEPSVNRELAAEVPLTRSILHIMGRTNGSR